MSLIFQNFAVLSLLHKITFYKYNGACTIVRRDNEALLRFWKKFNPNLFTTNRKRTFLTFLIFQVSIGQDGSLLSRNGKHYQNKHNHNKYSNSDLFSGFRIIWTAKISTQPVWSRRRTRICTNPWLFFDIIFFTNYFCIFVQIDLLAWRSDTSSIIKALLQFQYCSVLGQNQNAELTDI